MRNVRLSTLVSASALMLGLSFVSVSGASAQELEPNSTCAAPQNLGAPALPFALQGSLDTPDVDFYRFSVPAGTTVQIRLDGSTSGGGTLYDPYLGVFSESCELLSYNDDYGSLSSGMYFTVPASGTFVVAATSYGDWELTGTGSYAGTYRLTVAVQQTAQAIGGRVVNATTGAPVPNSAVLLLRCDENEYCYPHAGWTSTDGQGAFRFQNGAWNVNGPLHAGSYRLEISSTGYMPGELGPFAVAEGQDLNVGDIPIAPIPAAGSIRGRLVDEISGQPLAGTGTPWARVDLVHCPTWGCYIWGSRQVGADGTFVFVGTEYYRLPPASYYLIGYADQYQSTQGETFLVEDGQHYNAGDFRVKSNPARVSLVQSCGAIPTSGGACSFTMRVTNGAATRLQGESWAVVHGNYLGSSVQQTTFSVGSPRTLNLASGASTDVALSFEVPGEVSDGAVICVQGFASQRPHKFNTLGAHDLFCLQKGLGGFTQVPAAQKPDAVRRAKGEAVPGQK